MAIEYGMSVREFWEDNPDLFWIYRFSYVNKLKQKHEYDNVNAWLQGAYFYEAVSAALSNAFSKKTIQYRDRPFELESSSTNKETKQNTLEAQLKARAMQVQKLLGGATNE